MEHRHGNNNDQTPIPSGASLDGWYAEKALGVLKDRIGQIRYVSDWVELLGGSRGRLYQLIENHYGVTPAELLRTTRYKRIVVILKREPDATSNDVGDQVGLEGEQGMYKFLSRWHDTNFTELRHKILQEKLNGKKKRDGFG